MHTHTCAHRIPCEPEGRKGERHLQAKEEHQNPGRALEHALSHDPRRIQPVDISTQISSLQNSRIDFNCLSLPASALLWQPS